MAQLVGAEWAEKFKAAFDLQEDGVKKVFDDLVLIRQQVRNYVSHGSFGKNGAAFHFHSGAGAVPVLWDGRGGARRFTIGGDPSFVDSEAFEVLDRFVDLVWSGPRAPAKDYIQGEYGGHPSILTYASDGTYERAMASEDDMAEFIEYLDHMLDQAANMDF